MDWYLNYKLVEEGNGFTVVIDLNPDSTEFSSEIVTTLKDNLKNIDEKIRELIDKNYSDIKINSVKLVLGTLIVASVPFVTHTKVSAAETTTSVTEQVNAVSYASLNTTGIVTATRLNVRSGPATTYSILHVLWQGNKVKVIGESSGFYKIQLSDGRTGWVSKDYLQVDIRQEKIDIVISTAKSLIGTPYVWGGNSLQAGGFDCSGFTQYVYGKAGYTLNRISRDQALQGTYVSRSDLKPGDLVFFGFNGDGVINHVGLYIGNGQMIHSPKTGDVVKVTDITTSYWQSRFITARRII